MTPLSDRVVILGLVVTVALCFALAFWAARLNPSREPPMLWRDSPETPGIPGQRPQGGGAPRDGSGPAGGLLKGGSVL